MDEGRLEEVRAWVIKAGLYGTSEPDLLRGFCKGLHKAGLPVARALVIIDTLHPVHEGRVFRWRSDNAGESETVEYGRTSGGGEAAESWRRSPFYHLLQSGASLLRRRLSEPDGPEFALFDELRSEGQTDYLAVIQRFAEDSTIGEMDCVYSSWTTAQEGGFTDAQIEALQRLVPSLSLAVKSASLSRILETLVETYLGRDAGRRVLQGRIQRGVADRIEAVLWFSDLRGFTRVTDTAPPGEVIPFLNDYADAVISAVHEAGGDVLKLVGDGTLAIFTAEEPRDACRCALKAESLARERIRELNARREAEGLPVTQAYLGLHIGEVFYGNIGSQERLDFTVVGPAVNEVSRIGQMCRSAERDVLMSSAFVEAAHAEDRSEFVSVGRYALRGVGRSQELFTRERP
ncbi:adenylate/guanylate cyclase domain-containing protein [Enterovirga aerilata]|uniref:Adenylate/guanylate cyclase domain-containing protein n=1 Tax=Enterovirga aerilata TaxID=2730920 RepID=A0A849I1T6_9HYPH|nr:adenylate/guanylate cyclase domain-containing protein [Enterovirga sp. DB1703]NNM71308.1 adenylate/guanylate cyclase domain-containing protein [Enterovirga sp. DB1703]